MGKSTVAGFFKEAGIPVWDADEVVDQLYRVGGAGVKRIEAIRPEAIKDYAVDRQALKDWIAEDETALRRIEAQIHPLVARERFDFIEDAERSGARLIVLDIPLLYETGADKIVDKVLVVTAPAKVQRERVMARPGMTKKAFEGILAKQLPDEKKRARADYVIESVAMEPTRRAVKSLIRSLRGWITRRAKANTKNA